MKSSSFVRAGVVTAALAIISQPSTSMACAMCMSATDSQNGPAINAAIFFMLGVLAFVFSGIIYIGYTFVRRAKQPLPPHVEIIQAFDSECQDIPAS